MEAGGIGALEPRDAPPELTGCPYCQRADEVRRVPMAVEAGAGLAPAAPPVRFGKLPLNDGWYCGRCGLVYFQPGYEPKGVALRQALSPAQFQHEVYRAGGYQDLAGENEV
jgi:ribosomal protein L37AE/L43A